MPGNRRRAVVDACSSITESICDVVRTGCLGEGGSIVTMEEDGERLWWRICDSTAYFAHIVGKETCTLWVISTHMITRESFTFK